MSNPLIIKKSMTMMLALVMLLSIVGSAMAQENRVAPGGNAPAAPSQQQGPADPAELEAFLDDLFARQMEEHHIAGAAVSVVKDGKLFFAKGYGYANLEEGIPVDPGQTVFRIGSVGKLFTWTAVMQLVEQGKLDLDAAINSCSKVLAPLQKPGFCQKPGFSGVFQGWRGYHPSPASQ